MAGLVIGVLGYMAATLVFNMNVTRGKHRGQRQWRVWG